MASAASALAAAVCSRVENRHAARPMNSVAHIYDGGPPPAHDGGGRNTLLGLGIHSAASVWWALFFEALPRELRDARGAVAVAGLAYLVGGFAIAAGLNRRLDDHEKENRDERDERRPTQRRPHRVVAPEPLA